MVHRFSTTQVKNRCESVCGDQQAGYLSSQNQEGTPWLKTRTLTVSTFAKINNPLEGDVLSSRKDVCRLRSFYASP